MSGKSGGQQPDEVADAIEHLEGLRDDVQRAEDRLSDVERQIRQALMKLTKHQDDKEDKQKDVSDAEKKLEAISRVLRGEAPPPMFYEGWCEQIEKILELQGRDRSGRSVGANP